MNADEKNAVMDAARTTMTTAMALVIAEVFSGLAQGAALLLVAAGLIRSLDEEQYAVQAEQRAAECAGILAIPWPFIYVGSTAWIAAVRQLRDSLPGFLDLQPVEQRRQRTARDQEARAVEARGRWQALPDAQRSLLTQAGLTPDMLRSLGSV
jgi:hypothetical protein